MSSGTVSFLHWLRLPSVAERALDRRPAWLFSASDGALLWANAAGARALGADSVALLISRGLPAGDVQRRQALQLARSLGTAGAQRLERLRGFGASLGALSTCSCRGILDPEGEACVLIVAAQALELSERERFAGLREDIEVPARATLHAEPVAEDAATEQAITEAIEPMTPPPPRKLPLRFMWSSDAGARFSIQSTEFLQLLGPDAAAALDRPWPELAARLGLEPAHAVTTALAAPRTFNGALIEWPTDDPATVLPVELSGVPFYNSARSFAGFRGFGLVRDLDALSKRDAALAIPPVRPMELSAAVTPPQQAIESIEAIPAQPPVQALIEPTKIEAVVEPPANVVPFRSPQGEPRPTLTAVENSAFNELARQLSRRLDNGSNSVDGAQPPQDTVSGSEISGTSADIAPAWLAPQAQVPSGKSETDVALIDRIPTGVLIYRLDRLLYANPAFLEQAGFPSLAALTDAGGLDALYVEPGVSGSSSTSDTGTPMRVSSERSDRPPADAVLHTIDWDGEQAMALIFAMPRANAQTLPEQVLPEPAAPARAQPQPVIAVPEPAPLPPAAPAEEVRSQRQIDRAADVKAEVLARISHEVRTPLNAIIGFSEVMIAERFGALGNERYADYLKDIRASGERVIAVINDMLDLSHIETGRLDLTFANQNLNDLVEQCVGVMQPQANRERIIIRTALARSLPWISADARALRQIAMNLIGNSIHLANAGGQVIVSTALSDIGDVMLRVRDTGQGLNDNEIATALAPFRAPMAPTDVTSANSGVSLSLTKALVEANRAQFQIKSSPQAGTLIEVRFPSTAARAG